VGVRRFFMVAVKRLVLGLLLLLLFCGGSSAQQQNISFEHLSVSQGLSVGLIKCILQDRLGFIWIGTDDGLNRYDGYSFTVYRHDTQDPNSLSHNVINCLYEDREGNLWIGTSQGGLNRYNRQTDNFTVYRHDPASSTGLRGKNIYWIYQDRDGTLWIKSDELNRYDPKTDSFTAFQCSKRSDGVKDDTIGWIYQDRSGSHWLSADHSGLLKMDLETGNCFAYRHDPKNPKSISNDKVAITFEDSRGMLWIVTKRGLNRYDPKTDSFFAYLYDLRLPQDRGEFVHLIYEDRAGTLWAATREGNLYGYNPRTDSFTNYLQKDSAPSIALQGSGMVSAIYEDRAGTLWFCTWGKGIYSYDEKTDSLINYRHRSDSPISLSNDQVTTVYEDRSGILWFGTWGGGLNKYDRQVQKFILYRKDPYSSNSLSDNSINAICEDRTGILWVGTRNGGLNRYDPKTGSFTVYRNDPKNSSSISSNVISVTYEDSKGRLWIGTGNGLNRYDPKTDSFVFYGKSSRSKLTETLPSFYIHAICEDRDGSLLIGFAGGDGLYRYYPETDSTIIYKYDNSPAAISAGDVYSIYVDREGTLWAGTYNKGLNKYNPATNSFTVYQHDQNNSTSLSENRVTVMYEDSQGTFWVGTTDGLNRYDPVRESFTRYFERDGLPNSSINGILEDSKGNLWLSTNKGLSKFNPRTLKFSNYDVSNGLQGNEFYHPAYYKSRSGEMFFGGSNGFNRFDPAEIKENPFVPPVIITSFKVFDEPLPGAGSILAQSAEGRQERLLELSYNENFLSFEFAALSYSSPEKNRYSYRLEGLEENWSPENRRRYARYTNLDPGEYTFRVKGSNSDRVWNEQGAAIRIKIVPPPWLRWWAYSLYMILLVGSGWGVVRIRRRRMEAKARLREAQMQAEAAEIANRAKSTFLANMSHELRTPLNAILGFAQITSRDRDLKPEVRENLTTITRSGEHLLGLINDVLSISKIEAGKVSLKVEPFNLHNLLSDLRSIFQIRSKAKDLEFICEVDPALPKQAQGDEGKLRQILINLLGNAVKFTNSGKILLRANWRDGQAFFEVEDTGYGIAEEELQNIFESFVQTESGQHSKEGTGLGLYISRNFARLMGGEITVTSELGKGTIFRLEIDLPAVSEIKKQSQKGRVLGLEPGQPDYRILVVDDRAENRTVLNKLLTSTGFNVREVCNGKEALEIWRKWQPDLIWMDMRMKVMDGYAATEQIRRELKESQSNGHPPASVVIIALTASAFEQDHSRILASGCDDIVTKPYLESTIFEKLEQYLRVRFRYSTDSFSKAASDAPFGSTDQDLTARLKAVPEELLKQMHRATLKGSTTMTLQTIDEIGKSDEALAAALRQMVKAYRMHELIILLEKI
jgi:two-component system, sensor histidine kinase ChiS